MSGERPGLCHVVHVKIASMYCGTCWTASEVYSEVLQEKYTVLNRSILLTIIGDDEDTK